MTSNPISTIIRLFKIAIALFILTPSICWSDTQVTLQWDPNNPAPQGYRLYCRSEGQAYNYADYIDTGQATTHTVTGLQEDITYYFVVRAYVGSDVSGDSNEVVFNPSGSTGGGSSSGTDTQPPNQPYAVSPLDNAQDIALQPDLVSSNFYDVDGDYHAESRWQIYRLDTDDCVLDMTSNSYLTRLTVPSDTLEQFTAYYWTVRHISQNGVASLPSDESYFTTGFSDSGSSLSTNSSRGGSGGGSGGCFIQTLEN